MEIIPPEQLGLLRERLRAAAGMIVFTHGVFDLLHPQLIEHLRQARASGECLIVALHSDASARKIYGDERPVVPLEERAEVLSALEMIDFVTWFDDATPEKIIREVGPDIVIASGDDPLEINNLIEKISRLP